MVPRCPSNSCHFLDLALDAVPQAQGCKNSFIYIYIYWLESSFWGLVVSVVAQGCKSRFARRGKLY